MKNEKQQSGCLKKFWTVLRSAILSENAKDAKFNKYTKNTILWLGSIIKIRKCDVHL
jgi:hypothetical protein